MSIISNSFVEPNGYVVREANHSFSFVWAWFGFMLLLWAKTHVKS